jgi:hypothetical protein
VPVAPVALAATEHPAAGPQAVLQDLVALAQRPQAKVD